MASLKNKIVLITGGSSGYGKATAKAFVDVGAKVIIAARSGNVLEDTKKEIGCADALITDVTLPEEWEKLKDFIIKKYGKLDILINNAGGGVVIKEVIEQEIDDIDKAIKLNLNSVIYGSRVFGKIMKEQKSGTIINVSSVCAKQAWPAWSVYAAAKAGVLNFSKGLYVELQPYNVRVSCIIPAAASTGFQKEAGINNIEAKLSVEDIAKTILHICSLPDTAVIEEVTVWGIDQVVIPL